jgi:single-strand DNA-binding protein
MRTVNRLFLVGNLGADPEVRVSNSGRYVAHLSVATRRPVREGEGWSEVTEWHRVVLFDWQARAAGERLQKGDGVALVGELRYRSWVDKHNEKRLSAEVIARDVSFLGKRRDKQDERSALSGVALPMPPAPERTPEGPPPEVPAAGTAS